MNPAENESTSKGILLLQNMYHIEVDCAKLGPSPSSFHGVWTAVEVDAWNLDVRRRKLWNSLQSLSKNDDKATNIGQFEMKSQ